MCLRSYSLCMMVILVPLTPLGQWAFYPKWCLLRAWRPGLLSGSGLAPSLGSKELLRVILIHFGLGASQQLWGATNIHTWLASAPSILQNLTPSGSTIQKKPSNSHLPSPLQPASETLQPPGCIQTLLCCPGSNPVKPELPKCHCPQWQMLIYL